MVGLTWNAANAFADGAGEARDGGLTAAGRALVARLGELGVSLDLSHLSRRGCAEALEAATGPVLASHCLTDAVHAELAQPARRRDRRGRAARRHRRAQLPARLRRAGRHDGPRGRPPRAPGRDRRPGPARRAAPTSSATCRRSPRSDVARVAAARRRPRAGRAAGAAARGGLRDPRGRAARPRPRRARRSTPCSAATRCASSAARWAEPVRSCGRHAVAPGDQYGGMTPSDADLLRRLRGDPQALEAFYRRHVDRVRRFAARRCARPEDVADAVSGTFLAVLDAAPSYDPRRGEPVPWLLGIAAQVARRPAPARGPRATASRSARGGHRLLDDDDYARIEAEIDAERLAGHLRHEALAALSGGERELFLLVAARRPRRRRRRPRARHLRHRRPRPPRPRAPPPARRRPATEARGTDAPAPLPSLELEDAR